MCLFCDIAARRAPAHIVFDDGISLAFLDHRPVFHGHSVLIPKEHYETLADLPPDLIAPLFASARRLSLAMEAALGADGSFVAINNRVSQSVPHLHVHVVPRRRKDGLRGFFWPRHRYDDDVQMAEIADALRAEMQRVPQERRT